MSKKRSEKERKAMFYHLKNPPPPSNYQVRRRMDSRSPHAQAVDRGINAKNVYNISDKKGKTRWYKHPNQSDINHIDGVRAKKQYEAKKSKEDLHKKKKELSKINKKIKKLENKKENLPHKRSESELTTKLRKRYASYSSQALIDRANRDYANGKNTDDIEYELARRSQTGEIEYKGEYDKLVLIKDLKQEKTKRSKRKRIQRCTGQTYL